MIFLNHDSKIKIDKPIINYLDLLICTSLNQISIRSRLVSQPKTKSISNNEQIFNVMDLLPSTFLIIVTSDEFGENPINSQIQLGTMDEDRKSNVLTIKISLDSGASASTVRRNVLHRRRKIFKD